MRNSRKVAVSQVLSDELIETAHQIADGARKIALQYWRSSVVIDFKADDSPVSIADKSIESYARGVIRHSHPTHSIIGEEEDNISHDSKWTWIIDPIDGTKAFICGGHYWGVMIALCYEDDFVLGLIDFPTLNERYFNVKGQATTLNNTVTTTSDISALSKARALTTSPEYFQGEGEDLLNAIRSQCAVFGYGGDCFLSATIARGDAEIAIESQLEVYDIAAAVPIIEGAGGVIRTWQGQKVNRKHFKDIIICANEPLYQSLQIPN